MSRGFPRGISPFDGADNLPLLPPLPELRVKESSRALLEVNIWNWLDHTMEHPRLEGMFRTRERPGDIKFNDMDWFLSHFAELRAAYPDMWLAISGQQVVAADRSLRELRRQIPPGYDRVFLASTDEQAWWGSEG